MRFFRSLYPVLFLITFLSSAQERSVTIKDTVNRLYVGTYTKKEGHVDGKGKGIYLLNQYPDSGKLEYVCLATEIINPSFVKAGKMGRYIFAVSELTERDADSGFLYSYEIMPDGALRNISKVSTEGFAPCHIAIDKSGNFLFVSNYIGGNVVVYKISPQGDLEWSQTVQLENPDLAHAHSVKLSGDNRYAYIADLGNDKIWIYNFDRYKGKLSPHEQTSISLEKGAGPRHLSLAKNGNFAYSMNELNNTVSVFSVNLNGGLEMLQTISSLPERFKNKSSGADIHIHPDGRFLYASNRGHNSIVIYEINQSTGKLRIVDFAPIAGETPRNFAISPYGRYLYAASQDTGNITSYKINADTGKLQPIPPVFEIKTPVCLEFIK